MSPPATPTTTGGELVIGPRTLVSPLALIGFANAHPEIFSSDAERITRIGADCQIGPWALIYEGAKLEDDVTVDVRGLVGSRTTIGASSRLYYGAQVHDNVEIGERCIIAGFVADNCRVGPGCSVFGALIHSYGNPGVNTWDSTDEIGPSLDEGVIVGWGAVLIGPIRIGARARIGANMVVREHVAPGEHVC